MKKITLFVCALVVAATAFATPANKSVGKVQPRHFTLTESTLDGLSLQKARTAADLDTVVVSYKANELTYQVGKPTDGILYAFYQMGLVAPYNKSLIFYNGTGSAANGTPCTWLVNGETVASNAWFYQMPVEFGDENLLPVTKVEVDGGDTIDYLDFQIAGQVAAYWQANVNPKFYAGINVAPAEFYSITNCAMYTEDPRNDASGDDWGIYGGGDIGAYKYGTKLQNPWDGGYFDTIVTFYQNPGVMVIDNITLPVFSSTGSIDGMFPGADDHVRLTLYPCGEDGWPDYTKPIVSATASKDQYTPADETEAPYYGLLQFDFLREEPETGIEIPTPITVEGDFWIALDEFNDGSANFGIFSDYYKGLEQYLSTGRSSSNTFCLGRDADGVYHTGLWQVRSTLMLSVTAYLPAFDAPEELEFAADETEKELDIPSNMWDDAMEIAADDWINVTVVTDYEEVGSGEDAYYQHLYNNKLTVTVGALPEGETYREGTIVIRDYTGDVPADIATIVVKQGENAGQAIDNVDFKHDGKSYNVLGIEVNDDYKGVIIRNGEKFIR